MKGSATIEIEKNPNGGWLPMPFTGGRGGGKLSRKERERYREHVAAHLDPEYRNGWHRPTEKTAEAVRSLLASKLKLTLDDLLLAPAIRLSGDELTAKQALVVAVDAAVTAGEQGRMLTTNMVFDALARHWSDHYRAVLEAGKAAVSYDMKVTTVRASWRDLLRNGIRLEALYSLIRRGCPGLYSTERVPQRGYTVKLTRNPLLRRYTKHIQADSDYRRRSDEHPRLLLAKEELPPRPQGRDVAGEWPYNIAEPGRSSVKLIRRLEATRLWVHVPTLVKDVNALEARRDQLNVQLWDDYKVDVTKSPARPRGRRKTKSGKLLRSPRQWAMRYLQRGNVPKVKALVEEYDTINGQVLQLDDVRDKLKATQKRYVEIRSAFYKLHNRRYQSVNFWATEVTAKDVRPELVAKATPGGKVTIDAHGGHWREVGNPELWRTSSRRGRWFRAAATGRWDGDDWDGALRPLVGVDVSTSQLQILAVFCGLKSLENELRLRPFKDTLAERAWQRDLDPADPFTLPKDRNGNGFHGPDDAKLKEAVKTAVMTHLYGSELPQVAYKLTMSPSEYGPGFGDAENIRQLLATGQVHQILKAFLPVCQTAAAVAYNRDKYAGFEFTDPFDRAPVRWNPVRRRLQPVVSGATKIWVYQPVGTPNTAGDYPVDRQKLARMVAPCLTHTLDAMFASLVVEQLNARGINDIVSVHDCWMVASDALPILDDAIAAASEPWLRALGPVYDALEKYLKKHKLYPCVRQWRAQWKRRVANADWPIFRVAPATLVTLEDRP